LSEVIVQSDFLLLQDDLLGAELVAVPRNARVGVLLLDELSLVLDPFLLDLGDFALLLLYLLQDIALLGG